MQHSTFFLTVFTVCNSATSYYMENVFCLHSYSKYDIQQGHSNIVRTCIGYKQ